jgi:RHH-type transcriptional regulator, rel operon repressor / antitoxin RelB
VRTVGGGSASRLGLQLPLQRLADQARGDQWIQGTAWPPRCGWNLQRSLRLDQLAQLTGRTKVFCFRQLIEAGLDDLKDAYLGAAVAKLIRLGQESTTSLDDVVNELGLDPAAL